MLERLRFRLASAEALTQLALLGVLCGLLAGGVIIAFRIVVEYLQSVILPGGGSENYEALTTMQRLIVPVLGGLLIGFAFQLLKPQTRQLGVTHVMERLAYHQGYLPWRNAVAQFFGAAVSIASGHSVGREGPSVHLGATNGSLLGQWLQLPNNSIRTLVASGVAAAIAASFNTPLAGVIFAMEVVLMEYTITGFTPVILAAVSATALSRLVYGSAPAFVVPALSMGSIQELPYILVMGLAIGGLAAAFIALLHGFGGLIRERPVWERAALGGLLTGVCAVAVPQVMGIGYDTVNSAMLGELGLWTMLAIVAAKLIATAAAIGLGLPGGLIGPTLVIGAAAGGAMGLIAGQFMPGEVSSHGFYAMVGMGAMMGATLQAPLAALIAMLELTANPNILLPGMLAVIAASLTSSEAFGRGPVFVMLMRVRGLDYRNDPISQSLRRLGVAGIMSRSFVTANRHLESSKAQRLLDGTPMWIVVSDKDKPSALLPAADLVRYLGEQEAEPTTADAVEIEVDLLGIPGRRRQLAPISLQATLQEAQEALEHHGAEALYVMRATQPGSEHVYGVLTVQDIEAHYRSPSR
ncbi:MAG: hypothetical protein AMJ69_02370 [Gammaproteobacteria bacterium SG8_47]|nr:MAG: hypothetical protein AMJ69_02370 [Gammaproteobacteria bacterium SG8_47]